MIINDLNTLSPLDGRYKQKTEILRKYFSESALISNRIKLELKYLVSLSEFGIIRDLTKDELNFFEKLAELSVENFFEIKKIEDEIHHDVKAVEYYLRRIFLKNNLEDISSYIHFALTSEDINNLAYRLMVRDSLSEVLIAEILKILNNLNIFAKEYSNLPMLARTHGQAAIPTTLGKEIMIFELRLKEVLKELRDFQFKGKLNGAVGGYHAMVFSYPKVDWPKLGKKFVSSLGFEFSELTTQIAPADDLVKLFSIFQRFNSILISLNQDVWRYISDGWLTQKGKENHIGSSTMPQKINPIEFENSEGNLGIANSLFEGFSRKLPISRLQRDLSESTVLRNIGTAFGYCLLAYKSLNSGLKELGVDRKNISEALNSNYNILLETWQTEARKNGDDKSYEKAMKIGKNKIMTAEDWKNLTAESDQLLSNLIPEKYLGLSVELTNKNVKLIDKFIKSYKLFLRKEADHD